MTTLRRITVEPMPELPPLRPPQPAPRIPYFPETLALLALGFGLLTLGRAIVEALPWWP